MRKKTKVFLSLTQLLNTAYIAVMTDHGSQNALWETHILVHNIAYNLKQNWIIN